MSSRADTVVELAAKYLGAPYKKNAWLRDAPAVFSCSTFTRYVFRQVGINLPRKAIKQATCGVPVDPEDLRPGDLLFVRGTSGFYEHPFQDGIGHVGIYVGDRVVISARNRGVTKEPVDGYLEPGQYRAIRRII